MKKFLFTLGIVLFAGIAEAQTHSCDKPALTGNIIITNSTFLFSACVSATVDADGIAIDLNGTVTFITVNPGTTNTTGKVAFPVSVTIPGTGNHTVKTAPFTLTSTGIRQVGPFSSPFVLVLEKPVPTVAPTNHLR